MTSSYFEVEGMRGIERNPFDNINSNEHSESVGQKEGTVPLNFF